MLSRRLRAFLVAMLCALCIMCIMARLGVEARGARADEVQALAGPGLVCRTSSDAEPEPERPVPVDGLDEPRRGVGSSACIAAYEAWRAFGAAATARERRGDPKASRGPPSFVVS